MHYPIMSPPGHTFFRGRYALRAVLQALGVGPGASVACQAFTCYAVPLPVLTLGAQPVYVDADPLTLSMDPTDLERKLDDTTAAVIVQHTFGIPGRIAEIVAIAGERGVPVIEDCCHGEGSTLYGRRIGGWGAATFHSYEWGKPIVAGVGGGLRVNDPSLGERVQQGVHDLEPPGLRQRALIEMQHLAFTQLFPRLGYWRLRRAYRLLSSFGMIIGTFHDKDFTVEESPETGWLMAPGSRRRLERALESAGRVTGHHRRLRAAIEAALLAAGLPTLQDPPGADSILLRYPFLSDDKHGLIGRAQASGVEISDVFATPIHPLQASQWASVGYHSGSCPEAERLSQEVVSLPLTRRVDEATVERTVAFLAEHGGGLRGIRPRPADGEPVD